MPNAGSMEFRRDVIVAESKSEARVQGLCGKFLYF